MKNFLKMMIEGISTKPNSTFEGFEKSINTENAISIETLTANQAEYENYSNSQSENFQIKYIPSNGIYPKL